MAERSRRWMAAAAGAVVVAAVGLAGMAPDLWARNFGVVREGRVYRSAALTPAATAGVVSEHGIRTIIDFGGFDKLPEKERIAGRTAQALGVDRVNLWMIGDGTGDPNNYVEALRILRDPSRGPVLVHCSAGAQRTSACVALYRVIEEGWDLERALAEARGYRHDPADNPRMGEYVRYWLEPIRKALHEGGRIDTHGGFGIEEAGASAAGPR